MLGVQLCPWRPNSAGLLTSGVVSHLPGWMLRVQAHQHPNACCCLSLADCRQHRDHPCLIASPVNGCQPALLSAYRDHRCTAGHAASSTEGRGCAGVWLHSLPGVVSAHQRACASHLHPGAGQGQHWHQGELPCPEPVYGWWWADTPVQLGLLHRRVKHAAYMGGHEARLSQGDVPRSGRQ